MPRVAPADCICRKRPIAGADYAYQPRRRYDRCMAGQFQFSIRFALVATAVIAGAIATLIAFPSWYVVVGEQCFAFLFATASIIAVMETTGRSRAFWTGTAIVFLAAVAVAQYSLVYHLNWYFDYYMMSGNIQSAGLAGARSLRGPLAALWCAAPINGVFAALCHWVFSRRED
jgi:hypothetical protein